MIFALCGIRVRSFGKALKVIDWFSAFFEVEVGCVGKANSTLARSFVCAVGELGWGA